MRIIRPISLTLAAMSIGVAIVVSACSTGSAEKADNIDADLMPSAVESEQLPTQEAVAEFEENTMPQKTVASWAALAMQGAVEADYFLSVADITRNSSVVIVGKVVGLGPVRTIVGDAEGDVLRMPSLEVEILDVLSGKTHGEHITVGDTIIVESLRVPPEGQLPRDPVVMFLKYKADPERNREILTAEIGKYRLISSQGVMRPGSDGRVDIPVFRAAYVASDDPRSELQLRDSYPLLGEIASMTLDDLKRTVREIAGS